MKKKTIISIIALYLICSYTFAQNKRTIGLSANVQSNQLGISLPIWVNQKIVLEPFIGIQSVSNIGTDLSIGLIPKYYFKNEKFAPYLGMGLGIIRYIPSNDNAISKSASNDFLGSLLFGIDYFIEPKFSVGIQAQGNCAIPSDNSNRFGSMGNNSFNTATVILVSLYF